MKSSVARKCICADQVNKWCGVGWFSCAARRPPMRSPIDPLMVIGEELTEVPEPATLQCIGHMPTAQGGSGQPLRGQESRARATSMAFPGQPERTPVSKQNTVYPRPGT
jgi:hypothetical protein